MFLHFTAILYFLLKIAPEVTGDCCASVEFFLEIDAIPCTRAAALKSDTGAGRFAYCIYLNRLFLALADTTHRYWYTYKQAGSWTSLSNHMIPLHIYIFTCAQIGNCDSPSGTTQLSQYQKGKNQSGFY